MAVVKSAHEAERRRPCGTSSGPLPSWVGISFMTLAAGVLIFVGHHFSRKSGKRLGGKGSDEGYPRSTRTMEEKREVTSLDELRKTRAQAAEARLRRNKNNDPSSSALTPLGNMLKLAHKVDKLEEEISIFLSKIGESMSSEEQHDMLQKHGRLIELLMRLQSEISHVQADESIRLQRRIQTKRVEALITALGKLEEDGLGFAANSG